MFWVSKSSITDYSNPFKLTIVLVTYLNLILDLPVLIIFPLLLLANVVNAAS